MLKWHNLTLIIFFLTLISFAQDTEKKFCSQCENEIKQGKPYLTSGGKNFCDQECYEKSLPKCAVCGKPVKNGYIQGSKNYCSDECLRSTWDICSVCGKRTNSGVHFGSRNGDFYCMECSEKPVCFACNLPNDCRVLKDGRNICPDCSKTSITSYKQAMDVIRDVRKIMKDKLGIYTENDIKFELVDKNYLNSKSQSQEMELGLFYHEQRIKTETSSRSIYGYEFGKKVNTTQTDSFNIYLLTDLPKEKFIEVTAHELAHDWMEMKYPGITDPKITEGWAEYTASRINSLYGNEYLNKRMKENTNPVYGDGYRYISQYVEKNKIQGLYKYFGSLNKNKK